MLIHLFNEFYLRRILPTTRNTSRDDVLLFKDSNGEQLRSLFRAQSAHVVHAIIFSSHDHSLKYFASNVPRPDYLAK